MGNRDVLHGDASVIVEVLKVMVSKYSSEVGDDAVRETESVDDIFKELNCLLCSSRNKQFVFDPLSRTCRWLCTRTRNHLALA